MIERPVNHRYSSAMWTALWFLAGWSLACVPTSAAQPSQTIAVDVDLKTGGSLSGPVVDHDDHGLVLVANQAPYVYAWSQIEVGSAYRARRALMSFDRGGDENLTAEDHFVLGSFALDNERVVVARNEFEAAKRKDPAIEGRVQEQWDHRRARLRAQQGTKRTAWVADRERPLSRDSRQTPLNEEIERTLAEPPESAGEVSDEVRKKVRAVYDAYGRKVQEVIGEDVVILETPHFLIHTDWPASYHADLCGWAEEMYAAVCREFGLDPDGNVFIAKCPVFCWRSKPRFLKFAALFDGYDGHDAIGYTRSIEANGHTHVVLLLRGRVDEALDQFAWTLVHEGTHAVVHRLYGTKLIPHWVNEGIAEMIAQRVLGGRCPAAANAELLAKQYVRYDWPITNFLRNQGPIPVQQYSLACSVVMYLQRRSPAGFTGFVRDLKRGATLPEALADNYQGMSLAGLEIAWRADIRTRSAPAGVAPDSI